MSSESLSASPASLEGDSAAAWLPSVPALAPVLEGVGGNKKPPTPPAAEEALSESGLSPGAGLARRGEARCADSVPCSAPEEIAAPVCDDGLGSTSGMGA